MTNVNNPVAYAESKKVEVSFLQPIKLEHERPLWYDGQLVTLTDTITGKEYALVVDGEI